MEQNDAAGFLQSVPWLDIFFEEGQAEANRGPARRQSQALRVEVFALVWRTCPDATLPVDEQLREIVLALDDPRNIGDPHSVIVLSPVANRPAAANHGRLVRKGFIADHGAFRAGVFGPKLQCFAEMMDPAAEQDSHRPFQAALGCLELADSIACTLNGAKRAVRSFWIGLRNGPRPRVVAIGSNIEISGPGRYGCQTEYCDNGQDLLS